MEFEPLYPVFVDFPVSYEIWQLLEIYIWNLLLFKLGKPRVFQFFRYRYEKHAKIKPVLILAVLAIFTSWLILVLHEWMQMDESSENQYPDFLRHLQTVMVPMPEHIRNRGFRFEFMDNDDMDDDD